MTKQQFIKKYNLTEAQYLGTEEIKGSLFLSSLTSIPEGFCPTVGRSLFLSSLTAIPKTFNPTVGRSLDLSSLTSIPEGFCPTVGGWLDLQSLTTIPEGFCPTVGGSLDLRSVTSIPEGFNPTVGRSLYLQSLTSIPKRLTKCSNLGESMEHLLTWQEGKYRVIDGIFCEVLSDKGNILKIKTSGKIMFAVTDGINWSHGDTVKEAREDLIYKISTRDNSQYKDIDVDKKMSLKECIQMYRSITGACLAGTKEFVAAKHKSSTSYSVTDIIRLTASQYGNKTFSDFFCR